MIWFTSDTHFGHANIIKYCKRPWLQEGDLDSHGKWINKETMKTRSTEMDEALIENWNSRVKSTDTVYHLGDFALTSPHRIREYVNRLNGKINIVLGNHDRHKYLTSAQFAWVGQKYQGLKISIGKQEIFLSHWCMKVWDKSHLGSWHLFGHSHGNLPRDEKKRLDVGVDAHNYKPVSFKEIQKILS